MNELDVVVDNCLRRMAAEGASIEQCLAEYPAQAEDLRPLLAAASRLNKARELAPPGRYRAAARARLMTHAESRSQERGFLFQPARRMAVSLTVLMLVVLASTTAFAQTALPGEALYGWKLNSEHAWWVVASDRVGVDLELVNRRTTELTKVSSDPGHTEQVTNELHEVLTRLEAELKEPHGPAVEQALLAHQKKLTDAGLKDDKLDKLVHGNKNK